MDYGYSYGSSWEDALDSIFAMSGTYSTLSSILGLAAYIFTALALYTIAKRREISKPWLAWIPVLDAWILGSLSDQFRYVVKGQTKAKRKILLTLSITGALLSTAVVVSAIVLLVKVMLAAAHVGYPDWNAQQMVGSALGLLGLSLVLLGVTIARMIVQYMALYDLYTSCDPGNNVLYLVLSIIPGVATVAQPLLLFLCRDKDAGMPPRRMEIPTETYREPWEPTEE